MAVSDDAAAIAAATLTQTLVIGRRLARGDTRVSPPKPDTIASVYREMLDLVRKGDQIDVDDWISAQISD